MSFYNNKMGYDYKKFLDFNENGVETQSISQVQELFIQSFKDIYGQDIDLSNNNQDKQFIDKLSEMFYIPIKTVYEFYQNMNPDNASNSFLDTICEISGVERKCATRSYVDINVKYTGSGNGTYGLVMSNKSFTTQQLILIDDNNREWIWTEGANLEGNFATKITSDGKTIRFYCEEYGPVSAIPNPQFIDGNIQLSIVEIGEVNIGSNEENDIELRERRKFELGKIGNTTQNGLLYDLKNLDGIKRCKIYNNDTSSGITAKDNTSISANSIYIILDYDETNIEEEISKTIHNCLTPTISTVGPAGAKTKQLSFTNPCYTQTFKWKKCDGISLNGCELVCLSKNTFSNDDLNNIKDSINYYLNTLDISEDLIFSKLLSYLNKTSKTENGIRNFIFTSGIYNSSTDKVVNNDNMFKNITSITLSGPSGEGLYKTYTLTLTTS